MTPSSPLPPHSPQSRLLVTHALDQEAILFCEAAITADILDALGNLKSAAMPITWPMIHRKMIPYKPYDTFAGRLGDQLVASSPPNVFEHVNDATSYETKRRPRMDDGEDGSGPRKIRRISDTCAGERARTGVEDCSGARSDRVFTNTSNNVRVEDGGPIISRD